MSEPTFGDPGDCHSTAKPKCPWCGKYECVQATDPTIAAMGESREWYSECGGEWFDTTDSCPACATHIETLIRDGRVTIAGLGQVSIEWSGGKPFGLRIMASNAVMERIRSMK